MADLTLHEHEFHTAIESWSDASSETSSTASRPLPPSAPPESQTAPTVEPPGAPSDASFLQPPNTVSDGSVLTEETEYGRRPATAVAANNALAQQIEHGAAHGGPRQRLKIAMVPRVLESEEELRCEIAQSRARHRPTTFTEILDGGYHGPLFPTFNRFSTTRLDDPNFLEYKVLERSQDDEDPAIFSMVYPVHLGLVDGRNMTLPGLCDSGIFDSKGYPLFYDGTRDRINIPSRSSGALYPIRSRKQLYGTVPDQRAIRTWAHMFQTDETRASTIIQERAMRHHAGDNHLCLLVKAYLAYFDSVCAALQDVTLGYSASAAHYTAINILKKKDWVGEVTARPVEIVNVLGGTPGYQEFWAHCCPSEPPVFATAISSAGVPTTSHFSHYRTPVAMVCLCDVDISVGRRRPSFFGRPNLVLTYIDLYVRKFGLQQQANEALQIAMLWPSLVEVGAHVSLPAALHNADWMGTHVDPKCSTPTAFQDLISSNPYVALASTVAGAWALRSQIYDFVTLLAAKRRDWAMDRDCFDTIVAWFNSHAAEPGVGWDFLLRHQFHVSPSFMYLTGLSTEPVDWARIMERLPRGEQRFPAHLRLIQPFWVKTSVCCCLPWADVPWKPRLQLRAGHAIATPCVLMTLLRMGLLDPDPASSRVRQGAQISPILDRKGLETIEIHDNCLPRLLLCVEHGVKISAFCARLTGRLGDHRERSHQPTEPWPVGGLLQRRATQDRSPNAMEAQQFPHSIPGMANPATVAAAKTRLDVVKDRLVEGIQGAETITRSKILAAQSVVYSVSDRISTQDPPSQDIAYSPGASEGGGALWCVLFLSRAKHGDSRSMARLRGDLAIVAGAGSKSLDELSPEEMAGVCSLLELRVSQISSRSTVLQLIAASDAERSRPAYEQRFHLHLSGNRWLVMQRSPSESLMAEPRSESRVDVTNMPCHAGDHTVPPPDPVAALASTLPTPHHGLSTRVRVLDTIIQRWKLGLVSTHTAIEWHGVLFPGKGIPRFLTDHEGEKAVDPTPDVTAQAHNRPPDRDALILGFIAHHSDAARPTFLQAFRTKYARDPTLANASWPFRSPETANKNNMTVADLLSVIRDDTPQETLATWFASRCLGNHTEFVTSVGVWIAGVDLCSHAWAELLSSGLLLNNEDTWLGFSKPLHEKWRKNGLESCRCSACWTQLLYPQSLFGRGGVEVDFENEVSNKARVPDDITAYTGQVWSAEYATQLIRQSIREVLASAMETVDIRSFDHFADHAYEWLVSGSAAGMPSAFSGTDVKATLRRDHHIVPRPTKRSVMETIPREDILRQLDSRPQIIAKLHQKLNETGGKARAIYGVTLWHYTFSNWLMAPFEKSIRHPNVDINLPNDKFLAIQCRRAQQAHQGACFSSYDYPDFNAMHTHYHMAMIYQEAAKVARQSKAFSALRPDEREAVLRGYAWLEDSVYTQACYLPGADEFIQTVGGLYSGNRDTTLINTILNIAYTKVVDTSCSNMGFSPGVEWRLCHGDDIISQHNTYGAALGWNSVAERANLKGQENKLLTDRSYHEYLRVFGCPDGKLRGCLARVAATFVNGNWETDYTAGAFSQVIELQATMGVLRRRGMRDSFVDRLWEMSVNRIARAVKDTDDDSAALRHALEQLLEIGRDAGALKSSVGRPREANAAVDAETDEDPAAAINRRTEDIYTDNLRREKDTVERLFRKLPDEVTRPYQDMLIGSLPHSLQDQRSLQSRLKILLQRSTYGTEMPKRFQIDVKQTPQLQALSDKMKLSNIKRGEIEKHVSLVKSGAIIQDHKVFATTMRRIKAFYVLLSSLDDLGGYSKTQLIAHLCNTPEALVQHVLITDGALSQDWRRVGRQSAAEVGALENELEIFLTGDGTLHSDEEVVVYTEDGRHNPVAARDLMLY